MNCIFFSGNWLGEPIYVKGDSCSKCVDEVEFGYDCDNNLCGNIQFWNNHDIVLDTVYIIALISVIDYMLNFYHF